VLIDEHQIEQVLVNMSINAVHAMSPGGVLTITTRAGGDGDLVEVEVKDNGKGIPPQYISHIFDPFFSTKGVQGTGLGLSVSYGIIRNHNGNIRVDSEVGKGTKFTVELQAYKQFEEEGYGSAQDNGD